MIWIAAHHGWSGLLGAFLMDAIDTYDKYLRDLTWGGYDTWLARQVQERFRAREGRPLVGDREILDLIAFAAKRNDPPVGLSSSHRRLIQTEQGSAVPTLLNHWRFVQGEPVFEIAAGLQPGAGEGLLRGRPPAAGGRGTGRARTHLHGPTPTALNPAAGRRRPPGAPPAAAR